jgi:hypothetical protein
MFAVAVRRRAYHRLRRTSLIGDPSAMPSCQVRRSDFCSQA